MASATKRSWKLQEFVAHSGSVNCLALGHKSGRVMVTGGDDKKVNMWAVGKPNCIMSLTGHTSPVDSVRFDNAEEMVVAGSLSGALKIWDLEAAKIVRTLTGHKSSIKSLDFHPYGDFVASGSQDTNIKLWDVRRKGCIFTYKGHSQCVNALRFSPDGRWIASGGEDGILKLWDLTAGKQLVDFRDHAGPLTAIEFHPNEFLLATSSNDKTVKFWDLESFTMVSSTDGESTGIRSIAFHPEGMCLYAASQDMLKVYDWEPAQCFDSFGMGWGRVADIAIAQQQLIGATFSQTNVSTFVVDLQRVLPFGGPGPSAAALPTQPTPSPPKTASGRRSFVLDRPHTQSSKQRKDVPKEEPEEPTQEDGDDDVNSSADIVDPANYNEVFKPRKLAIDRSPTRAAEPFPAPQDDDKAPSTAAAPTSKSRPTAAPSTASRPSVSQASVRPPTQSTARPGTQVIGRAASQNQDRPTSQNSRPNSQNASNRPAGSPKDSRPPSSVNPKVVSPKEEPRPSSGGSKAEPSKLVPANRNKPVDLNMEDFLPKQNQPEINRQKTPTDISESEAMSSIIKGHDYMTKVLTSRQKNLQIVRALWTSGNTKTAVDSALGMNDLPVIVDLLNVLLQKPGLWSLDLCATILPQLTDLLNSKYDNYVEAGCSAIKLVLRNFSSLIKGNITAPPSIGVDITREERYNKCKSCYKSLMTIRSALDSKAHTGKNGPQYRELQLLMSQLD